MKVHLTFENYRRLDVITRLKIGRPLAVFDVDAYREKFPELGIFSGVVGLFDGIVTKIPAADGFIEKDMGFVPHIANSLNIDEWNNSERLGIDVRKIPRELLYDFLVYHEIAHVLHGDVTFFKLLVEKGEFTVEQMDNKINEVEIIRMMLEYRADKYAWSKIMPGHEMPKRTDQGASGKMIDKAINNIQGRMRKYQEDLYSCELKNIAPISLDPDEYVPQIHSLEGLPTFEFKYGRRGWDLSRRFKYAMSKNKELLRGLIGLLPGGRR